MKHILTTLILFISTSLCFGQDYKAKFEKYAQEGNTAKQLDLLKKWEKEDPKNPELFTSYFNYYFLKARQEGLSITTTEPAEESLSFQDSTGKTAGFIGSQVIYEQETLKKGFDKIDEGIKLYPNRLDMRFGKIYTLGQIKDWERFTTEIVKTIRYSSKNDNNWTWTNNEKSPDGREFFLSAIQDYQLDLYYTENDDLLVNMRTIANEILKFYPEHIESLSNLAITYLLTEEFDKAITALLKAEKLAPTDVIILSNIAQGYKLKGNKERAIAYYEKTIQHGDEQTIAFAKQQIEELKK